MSNYPPGAEYDPDAPYNEEEIDINVYTLIDKDDCVYIDFENITETISGEDIHEYFSYNFFVNADFKYISQDGSFFDVKTSRGNYSVDKDDIIELFFTKYKK